MSKISENYPKVQIKNLDFASGNTTGEMEKMLLPSLLLAGKSANSIESLENEPRTPASQMVAYGNVPWAK